MRQLRYILDVGFQVKLGLILVMDLSLLIKLGLSDGILSLGLIEFILIYHVLGLIN